MKVLLIYPNMRGMNMLPSAIALFSAILKELGHTVSLFDSTDYPNPEGDDFDSDKHKEENLNAPPFDDSLLKLSYKDEDIFEAFEKHVENYSPDLALISFSEDLFPLGILLLERICRFNIPVLAGGVFPTFAPELVLSHSVIDMVCVGEGEKVITELCNRLAKGGRIDNIAGLWIKKNGMIIKNSLDPPIDMNKNPLPDLTIFNESRFYRPMQGRMWRMFPLETHRGCPYSCYYCNSPSQTVKYKHETNSKFFRKKNIHKIRENIIHLQNNYNAEALYFWADTFLTYSDRELDEFVEMYSDFKIPFWCQTRPESITYKRMKALADIGLFRMSVGIEHGNEEFRRTVIKRNITNKKIIEHLAMINDVKVSYSVNNILGFPDETRELTFDTIELNRQIKADSVNAYSFSPFHGTPLRAVAEAKGYIEPNVIARSLTKPTLLNMTQYPPEQIEGMRRCFVLYTKMPKSRWKEIEKAEHLNVEGNEIWQKLRDECAKSHSL